MSATCPACVAVGVLEATDIFAGAGGSNECPYSGKKADDA